MQSNVLITHGLPMALFIVMIGMGLSLTPADFRRVLERPRGVVVGTLGQLLIVPLLGFAIAALFNPAGGVLAAGLVLVALCPGGTTSNLICYLARADLALSITLTMLSSILTILSIPVLLNLALAFFTGDGELIRLSFDKTLITMASVVLLPTGLGMLLRQFRPALAQQLEPWISKFSALVLIAVVVAICGSQWAQLPGWLAATSLPVLALNLSSIAAVWLLARASGLPHADRLTIMVELSIKNVTVGVLIALTLLGNVELVIPSVCYGLLMYGSAGLLVAWGRKTSHRDRLATAASAAA